ncbi:F0F1 ATP synthase subunit epsilon [Clostridia bacterium]|nr:F0F1 ATP synthase subunit epsilon [Clostridia bacterium]
MDKLLLEIVSADKLFLRKEVDAVRAPGIEGDFGILAGHAPMIACIDIGVLRYRLNEKMTKVAVGGGFLEIFENKVSVLVDTAESREDIDVARARKAKEKAVGNLRKNLSEEEHLKMEAALRKALARITVAE